MTILITAQQAPEWCPWCGRMMGGGWTMIIFWLLLLVIVVALAWVFMRGRIGLGGWSGNRAEERLRERYARGEIDEETYRRMLDELRRSRAEGGGPPGR